jgi:catalase-peroxidase
VAGGDKRYSGERELANPLAAVQMGLIYVNPEGPNGKPDPLASARDIRETFARMAMNDEETVALTAGGHTFGKAHGAGDAGANVGAEPEARRHRRAGLRLDQHARQRQGQRHHHQRHRRLVDAEPDPVGQRLLRRAVRLRVGADQEPGRRHQWQPEGPAPEHMPVAHDPSKKVTPMMTTADMAMRMDPAYEKISRRFHANPQEFADAFARAWFKLTHRDMGPRSRYLGKLVPSRSADLAGPGAGGRPPLVDANDVAALKAKVLASGLSTQELVSTAWASASTFRGSDKRGGANGARIRLAPQKDWEANQPAQLAKVLGVLEGIQKDFNASAAGGKKVSLADLIVLAGNAAVEDAAKKAGVSVTVPFNPGRTDATPSRPTSTASRCSSPRPTASATTWPRASRARRPSA